MRWFSRLKAPDSALPSDAGRRAPSVWFGLWQITHSSIAIRCPPWENKLGSRSWHLLQFASATSVRRGLTVPPVTATYLIGLNAPSWYVAGPAAGAGFSVTVRRHSMAKVQVPDASAGIAFVKVYVPTVPSKVAPSALSRKSGKRV